MEVHPQKGNDPPPQYEPPTGGPQVSYDPGPQPYPPQAGQPYPPQAGQPYPPQGGQPYPPQSGQYGQTTVVIQQPHTVAVNGATYRYSQYPALIVCQHCQATVTTTMSYETGLLTWAVAGAICLFGLWLGCCLIPFCINATKDVEHTCPNCKNVVGKFRHFS